MYPASNISNANIMRKILLFISLTLFSYSVHSQEKRLALVIGNSAYEHGGVLRNPVNDAMEMKRALYQVGFDVLEYFNLDQGEMKRAIDDFGMKLRHYDVGLFFYAGHGIQADGDNFLIPVDAVVQSEMHVEYDCVRADRVLAHMEDARSKVNIVILDACRNNPFERSWSRSASGSGLAFMNAPSGTLIAYATAPGSVASDGTGMNGLYTEAILRNMQIPDISILEMFQNVRNYVNEKSNFQQTPWESTSLVGNFYFLRNENPITPSENISGITPLSTPHKVPAQEPDPFPVTAQDTREEFFSNTSSGSYNDPRDMNDYRWVRIGEQVWMAENLNFNAPGSFCLGNSAEKCESYGRLYSLEQAGQVCPDGWHLPTDEEWLLLERHIGLDNDLLAIGKRGDGHGYKLKSTENKIWGRRSPANNSSGFSALPGGGRSDGSFKYDGAYFWTAPSESGVVYYRFLHSYNGFVYREVKKSDSSYSVRCVKD